MILLIVAVDAGDMTPGEACAAVQRAIDGDPRCPDATVEVPG